MSEVTDIRLKKIADLKVPSPGFGGMSVSNAYGKADDEQSKELLRHAIKLGVTFWDSADIYGCGHNEKLLGSVLAEGDNRSKVFLATKFGFVFDEETGRGNDEVRGDREYIRQAIENSIRRLGTTPDLYYQHRVDPKTPVEETYSALEELRKEGKIKHIGISEPSVESLKRAAKVAKISALQVEYSPWTTDIERNGLLATARELGITIVAYSPLGRGFLTGRFKSPTEFEEGGVTPAQLCLAWVAAQGEDIIPIPGTKSIERLEDNWASREVKFTSEELKEIRDVIDGLNIAGERYPDFRMKHIGK
ncbi:hypothetical protein M422DRAFT_37954 [Sphaerobolus stellatus SS14]|uniref:NADP-dependent oxidoreductase domain-containing protein n=1 Tax=Sphaerobolus stellatus (strain SS14) TaxID=990650 RepID=A0A0C9TZ40_SPHS4|nr:hypothetical protein M422DRAFT_37954 [Sphaerobolus stellatus SS14]